MCFKGYRVQVAERLCRELLMHGDVSKAVTESIRAGTPLWESLVPKHVSEEIKANQLVRFSRLNYRDVHSSTEIPSKVVEMFVFKCSCAPTSHAAQNYACLLVRAIDCTFAKGTAPAESYARAWLFVASALN